MQTFDQHLVSLIRDGVITLEAAMLASTSPHDLTVELRRLGLVACSPLGPVHRVQADQPVPGMVERLRHGGQDLEPERWAARLLKLDSTTALNCMLPVPPYQRPVDDK